MPVIKKRTKYHFCKWKYSVIVFDMKSNELQKQLITGNTYKLTHPKVNNAFYIISPSAKEVGRIQATFFYNNIPYSDIIRTKMKDIIEV